MALTYDSSEYDMVSLARGMMLAGNLANLLDMAKEDRSLLRIRDHIVKAASTDGVSDLGVAFGQSQGFLEKLNMSALDVMRAIEAPIYTDLLNMTTAVCGVIGEREKLPVLTTLERIYLTPLKTGGLALSTRDVLRTGVYGEAMLGAALRNGVSACSNRALIDTLEADVGTVTVTASGTTGAHILADIASASAAFDLDARSRLYLLASPQSIKNLALKNGSGVLTFPNVGPQGGEILPNVECIACPGFPAADSNGNWAMLIDSGGLLMNKGTLHIQTTNDASLEMLDVDGGAAPLVNVFQEDLVALRYVRTFAVLPLRACVAKISAVAW